MANRHSYPAPSVKKGKKVLTDLSMLGEPSYTNKVLRFLEKQKVENMKTASLAKNDCLNSSQENIIFNDSNNMILNENILNSFFEKLAELQQGNVTTEQSMQSSMKTTNMSKSKEESSSRYNNNRYAYRGQRMARRNTNFRNPVGYNRLKQNNVPDGIPT